MLMLISILAVLQSGLIHFNTSHVNVNLHPTGFQLAIVRNFNTSHVNVNLDHAVRQGADHYISIHLMLMLIG